MSSWNYRLVRHPADLSVSVRVVWYDENMTMTCIEDMDATVSTHADWANEGETEVDLIREELGKFALALALPILTAPATNEEEV